MNMINNNLFAQEMQKINHVKNNSAIKNYQASSAPVGSSFDEILKDKISDAIPVQFSKHANMRLSARDISLSEAQMKRIEDGVQKAKMKGINDSLVLVDDIALVVNVRNKIVITALNKGQDDNVFTNIDGAVIV